jgi:hypothetical protein
VDFSIILHRIAYSSYDLPNLPPVLYKLATPPKSQVPPATPMSSISTNSHSSGSQISSLTTPTITMQGQGPFQPNNTIVDHHLQFLIPNNMELKLLIGTMIPPLSDDNVPVPLCLAYQFKQGCWTGCSRASTHRKLMEAKKQ